MEKVLIWWVMDVLFEGLYDFSCENLVLGKVLKCMFIC